MPENQIPLHYPLTDAQRRELDRRLDDHLAHPNDVIPWEEVKKEILGQH